jgi:hypothetical protein
MKKILFTLLTISIISSAYGQKRVALQSNGITTIYGGASPYIDAYNDAVDGDTLYLPGGELSSPSTYNKSLTIYGAGFRSDTSFVTEKTEISGFTIASGADNFHIEGVQVNGSIGVPTNVKVDSILLKRIRVTGNITLSGTNQNCVGFKIQECVVHGSINLQNTASPEITNTIMSYVSNIENGYIANNIIIANMFIYVFTNISQSLIENNYLANLYLPGWFLNNCSNNSFVNNAINYDPTADATNSWNGNFLTIAPGDLFIDYIFLFDEAANYNLLNPASFQGTTGNEIGIYGGYFPAKEGFIPENPHYQYKNIASQTNTNGELEVEITIEAQNE